MVYLAGFIGALFVCLVLLPFFVGRGGRLVASSSINSPKRLLRLKKAVLERYLADEAAYEAGHLPKRSWQGRRQFLSNRYIDASRRLDFLTNLQDRQSARSIENQDVQ